LRERDRETVGGEGEGERRGGKGERECMVR
jgi:hypothetical protein